MEIKNQKPLGELMVEHELITKEQLKIALEEQKNTNERLGKILIDLGYIAESDLIRVLSSQLNIESNNNALVCSDPNLINLLPKHIAKKYTVFPVKRKDNKLVVAMADPTNIIAIDDIRVATKFEIEPIFANPSDIERLIGEIYGIRAMMGDTVEDSNEIEDASTDDAPIIEIVNSIISQATKERASDIHFEPQEEGLKVRFRIDGVLKEKNTFPIEIQPSIISRLKIMSRMDIAERRIPQDGRFQVRRNGQDCDIRVSSLPTVLGEKIVLRVLNKKAQLMDVSKVGMRDRDFVTYKNIFTQPYGLVLVTGPTGSGKTTTLYSTIAKIKDEEKNIVTIEDPVEYRINGINQTSVNTKAGMNFASGLRSIVRQDPDVILVGEIRDPETAEIAISSALTGHLVFSTLHTNDSVGTISRLLDMGIEPFLVSSALVGIVAQRLVRSICPSCKEHYVLQKGTPEYDMMKKATNAKGDEQISAFKGKGCPNCGGTGYRGRIGVFEVLPVTPDIKEAIMQRKSGLEIEAIARKVGMQTMHEDAIQKVIDGLTSPYEILRTIRTQIN